MTFAISCVDCGATVAPDDGRALCAGCGGLLDYRYDPGAITFDNSECSIWRYRDLLPVATGVDPVTLGEGNGFREVDVLEASTTNGAEFLAERDAVAFLASLA